MTFKWSVSQGTIKEGQGTSTIIVDTSGLPPQCLKVTLEVGGIEEFCTRTWSCAVLIQNVVTPHKISEYGNIRFADEKLRLDAMVLQLKGNPNTELSIMAYDGRKDALGTARKRAERAKRYLIESGIEPANVRISADNDFVGVKTTRSMELQFYLRAHNLNFGCTDLQ